MKRMGTLIAVGLAAAALATPATGLEGFAGVKLCNACHKSRNQDIVAKQPLTGHGLALWPVASQDADHKVVGDFAANPGFKQADVAYVVGKGVRAQAYLDASFNPLPQEWAVAAGHWQPGQTGDAKKSCLGCHTTGYDVATGQWADEGVRCEACHGAGSNHARSSDKKATIVRPQTLPPERRAMICGRCHGRGKNADGLPFSPAYKPGDDLAQSFTLDATWEQGARNSQYNDLLAGKHLAQGVACDTCHDPHGVGDQPHQLRKPADDVCLDCHKPPLPGDQHSPPQDCKRCHMVSGSHQFEKPQAVPAPGAGK